MRSTTDVTAAIAGMARMYDKTIEGETIAFFAKILLSKLTADEACESIAKWCATQQRWPAPAHIIEVVYPPSEVRDDATELATRLRTAIARRGYTWVSSCRYDGYESISEAIRCELGEEALAVVERSGGWIAFCREWGGDMGDTSARAQLRGLCEVEIKHAANAQSKRIDPVVRKMLVASEQTADPERAKALVANIIRNL